MAKGIDLTSKEWLNFVFEGKNREYGAYELREDSSNRHIKALFIVTLACVAFIYLPQVIKSIVAHPSVDSTSEKGEVTFAIVDQPETPEQIKEIIPVAPPAVRPSVKFVDFIIARTDEVTNDDVPPNQLDLTDLNVDIAAYTAAGDPNATMHADDVGVGVGTSPTGGGATGEPIICTFVEQPPQFPGGDKELLKWLGENIKYPAIAIEKGIEGSVVLRFVVGPDGVVSRVEVLRNLDPSCDKEAVRAVKNMPNWIPGKQNGNAVYVYYTLPVSFKIAK